MNTASQQVRFTLLGLVMGCNDWAAGVSLPDGYREEDLDGAIDYILRDSHTSERAASFPTPDKSRAQCSAGFTVQPGRVGKAFSYYPKRKRLN